MVTFPFSNILFDFDGTIANTNIGIIRTVQETLRIMELPIAAPDAIRKTIGLPLDDCFRIAANVEESLVKEASRTYREIFMDMALDSITLFDGVLPTLAQLNNLGIHMAIASSRNMLSLLPLVKHLGVDQYIHDIFGEDESIRPKPHPDLALKIMGQLQMDPSQTLVVGDTIFDLMMGQSAGCKVCGVTFGNHSQEQLLSVKPNHLINNFPAILSIK